MLSRVVDAVSGTRRRQWAPRFLIALGLVSLAAGGFAVLFRAALTEAVKLVAGTETVVDAMVHAPWFYRLGLPMLGGIVAGLLALSVAKRGGGGVSDVMEAVALGRTKLSMRVTLVKSIASWCAIVTGGSIGREGPLIQVGGASGYNIATRFGLSPEDRRVLIAAGTAAGFAAAYNTPLAAVAFVVEIVAGIVVVETVVPTLVAVVIATVLTRAAVGAGPIYGTRSFVMIHAGELAGFFAVALLATIAAFGFTRLVSLGERLFHRTKLRSPWRQALGGLGAGAFVVFLPGVAGNGYEPLNALLDGRLPIGIVAALLVAKAFATTSSVASGSPGGVFTPILLIGGCTGYLVGVGLGHANLDVGPPGGYALVGMAAAIAGATHAPLMGAILAFELSGDYAVVLPLVLATASATALARVLGRDSIYMAELRTRGTAWELTMAGRAMPQAADERSGL